MKRTIIIALVLVGSLLAQGENYALTFESAKNDFGCLYFTDWNLDGSSEMTVSAWVRWSIVPTAEAGAEDNKWANILSNNAYDTPDDGQFWLQHNSSNTAFEFAVKTVSGRRFIFSSTQPQKDVWYHVCGVYDDNADVAMKLYIDGVKEAEYNSLSGTINPFSTRFITKMGRWSDSRYPRHFDGSIDEVTIWNRALSQAEVQTLMTNDLPADETGLQGYWKFDDASGDRFTDETGHKDGIIFSTYHGYGKASGGSSTTLEDNSDIWCGRDFSGRPVHIISGTAALQGGMIASNTATTLTLENQWNNYTEDPDNTSYYAISCFSKWQRYVTDNNQTSMGPAGKQIKATITSVPDNYNHLLLYLHGWLPADVEDGESIPAGFFRRAGFCWGVDDIGTVTENLVFDYSQVSGISDPSQVDLLVRDSRTDQSWEEVTETSRDDLQRTISLDGVSAQSEYVLASRNVDDFPLAVTLTDFSAEAVPEGVLITWTTETEVENLGFILERENASGEIVSLGNYLNTPALAGKWNSTETVNYEFLDKTAEAGMIYRYSLKDVGCCSGVRRCGDAECRVPENNIPVLMEAAPNPFNPVTNIRFQLPYEQRVELNIYDLAGNLIENLYDDVCPPGNHSMTWRVHDIPSGLYIYSLETPDVRSMKKCLYLK